MVSNKEISTNTFNAIYQYLDTLTREYVSNPIDFIVIRNAITDARSQVSRITDKQNFANLQDLLNTAMDHNAPVRFFKKLSETRMNGSLGVQNIAQFTARLGLIYYFELLSEEADFSDLQAFRERAIDLKKQSEQIIRLIQTSTISFAAAANIERCKISSKTTLIENQRKVIDRIDEMIYLLGKSISIKKTYQLKGSWNALVASYHLFGNVGNAFDITQLSFGVSGAKLNGVSYYQG